MLESLIRLAQAHARLCFQHEVTVTDAVVAVQTVEMSMMTSSLLQLDSVRKRAAALYTFRPA